MRWRGHPPTAIRRPPRQRCPPRRSAEQLFPRRVHVVHHLAQLRDAVVECDSDLLHTEPVPVGVHHEPHHGRAARHGHCAYGQYAVLREHFHGHETRGFHRYEIGLRRAAGPLTRNVQHVVAGHRHAGTAEVDALAVLGLQYADQLFREFARLAYHFGVEIAQRVGDADVLTGLSIPEELSRREERLAAIRQAKAQIEARAAERDALAKAEFDAKIKARADKTARTGKKPGGKPPAPPSAGVRPTDQINLTDADSRIMPSKGKGFEQSYNAQAAVDAESMLVVATSMAQVATDKQQVDPMLKVIAGLPEELGSVEQLLADNGYFSAANVEHCVEENIEPLLAAGRDRHHPHWEDRFTEPAPLTEPASAVDRMKHRLKTIEGRKLYGLRKQTVEPVFGIIKSVMGFRQFMLRGLDSVRGEWNLVNMAWNIKRMAVLAG